MSTKIEKQSSLMSNYNLTIIIIILRLKLIFCLFMLICLFIVLQLLLTAMRVGALEGDVYREIPNKVKLGFPVSVSCLCDAFRSTLPLKRHQITCLKNTVFNMICVSQIKVYMFSKGLCLPMKLTGNRSQIMFQQIWQWWNSVPQQLSHTHTILQL